MVIPSKRRIASLPISQCRLGCGLQSRPGSLLTILLVLPAAALLLTPFGLVALAAAADPRMLMVLAEKPLVAVQLSLGLIVSVLFCALPFSKFGASPARKDAGQTSEEPVVLTPPRMDAEPARQALAA